MKSAKDLIVELRAAGLSQSRIAQSTKLSQATISRIENGQSNDTSMSHWVRIHELHSTYCAPRLAPNIAATASDLSPALSTG
ncbi:MULTISPECIES: helix-turn-helix transcriptional regulator [Burkholderiaceae]|uniref:helix-turn-helix domain-containing protein n=1 Tax=Burkholderiaceae TaxID=119060 RepID=UPI000965816E|nr:MULTISPECIES: helix-turn-helix transcriptional regulator [Burkholderiaceae]MCG1018589.1 helix-turn-helix transcriptional regulator [Mycetohabitans sp. B4]SIT75680.1 Helix-turn-helix [Burkholderia sp. b13]